MLAQFGILQCDHVLSVMRDRLRFSSPRCNCRGSEILATLFGGPGFWLSDFLAGFWYRLVVVATVRGSQGQQKTEDRRQEYNSGTYVCTGMLSKR
jgi:hypothetical protein